MLDLVLPIAVLALLLLFVDQIRRLIAHAILNTTIRRAMETDPSSVPLLVAKLESGTHKGSALAGWIMLVGGFAVGAVAFLEKDPRETIQIAVVAILTGIGTLAYAWWVHRQTLGH